MNVINLLKQLIEIPSVSNKEEEISRYVKGFFEENGISAKRYKNNVYCHVGEGEPKLLLNSHLDTVPPCSDYTNNPYASEEKGGRIYGLGSNDAKGSVAAMMSAMVSLSKLEDLNGKIYFGASVEEEVGNKGIEMLTEKIPRVEGAVVGEPTSLNICTGMRGLLILKFTAKGKSGHASRPEEGDNAIYKAISDIDKIKNIKFEKEHDLLGYPSVAVTVVDGGIKHNMIPDKCRFTADIRTTPLYESSEIISKIKKQISSDIKVYSDRLNYKETNTDEKIVNVALQVNPDGKIKRFGGICDLVFIDEPGIIMGPGTSEESHSPDESIGIDQVRKAVDLYYKLGKEFVGSEK